MTWFLCFSAGAQLQAQEPTETELEEISRKLDNPLTSLWSLVIQDNLKVLKGDAIDGSTLANTFFFQPSLPVPVLNNKIVFARPVFPLVTSPEFDASGEVSGLVTGFGDIQLLAAFGPERTDGFVWGLGATFKFPTATEEALGEGKWQAGPGGMFFYLGRPWTLGILFHQWWSFAGDDACPNTSRTEIQYTARRQFPGAWSIGMGPTISVDWKAPSGQRVTLPIGLGMVRFGSTPVKMRLEPQYSIARPDVIGTAWNIRIQIAPVIRSPFAS